MSACLFMMSHEWFQKRTDSELLVAIDRWQRVIEKCQDDPEWGNNRFLADYASGSWHNIRSAELILWKRQNPYINPYRVTERTTKPSEADYDGFRP